MGGLRDYIEFFPDMIDGVLASWVSIQTISFPDTCELSRRRHFRVSRLSIPFLRCPWFR